MIRIVIMEESPVGYADVDRSIDIPEKGNLEKEIDNIPEGQPKVTTFDESYTPYQTGHPPKRTFLAVRIDDFYMLWIEERNE